MDVSVHNTEVLLAIALLLKLAVLFYCHLSEFELCVSKFCSLKSDTEVFTDEAHLEATIVISAGGDIFKDTWAWIIGINAPTAACTD